MVSQNHRKISTLDLIGNGKFTLFCWLQGDKWKLAVDNLNRQLNLDIKVIQVGPKEMSKTLMENFLALGLMMKMIVF